ncbi:MAG: hypothetical protein FJ095_17605 [Deltaproteobacteria bacterium]|nr:hypothetical protein [Deltaproteobacteria bacterium]
MSARRRPTLLLLAGLASGCRASVAVPPPEAALASYVSALERGDAQALYALFDDESRRALSVGDAARLLDEQRAELREHGQALATRGRLGTTRAELRFQDGEVVGLAFEGGEFRVEGVSGLPSVARTPTQALGQLRAVLARRSYAGLLRVLSPAIRAALEGELRSLVEGLREPDALPIDVSGDLATVIVPGGHKVKLRREDGAWHVDDLD